MAHSEGEIRKAVKVLVDAYGELTTSEVKKCLEDVLTFDAEDLIPSKTRNETLIIQRIGNIVSHQSEKKKLYPEGFILDKSFSPARFFAVTGVGETVKPITQKEVKKRKKRITKSIKNRRVYKKVDWELNNERNSALGAKGEEFVYSMEREYVKGFDPGSVDRVIHLSVKQGDGFGYDISSINKKGETVFIEVKTTKGKRNTPFYMSRNERLFFEENIDNNAYIYRVYDFDENSCHGKILKISASELFKDYDFDPVTYLVSKKK